MKKIFTILTLAALCFTACDCPDCGNTVSSANVNTIFVTKTPGGDFNLDPGQIIIQSSCNWTAINLTPQYLDFANTNGTGGVHYLPIGLTPEFYAALAEDISNFPVDATGDRKIGTVHFDSDCEAGFDVHIYLQGFLVLSFSINGGEGATPKPVGFVVGETITIPENTTGMTFSPKTFVGWNTKPDGTGTFYDDGSLATFSADAMLYALWEGDGSSASAPLYIYNHLTLDNVRNTVADNLYYLVVADFHANYDEVANVMHNSWEPIGGPTEPNSFTGVLEGNNHTITYEITDDVQAIHYFGLFGHVGSLDDPAITGTIKNLTVKGGILITGGDNTSYAGGIAGYLESGEISNCVVEMDIDITEQSSFICVGGVIGGNDADGMVQNVHVTGTFKSTSYTDIYGAYTGGIIGNNLGVLKNATASVNIYATTTDDNTSAGSWAGGLAGQNEGLITQSSATAHIFAKGKTCYAGGVVGMNRTGPWTGASAPEIRNVQVTGDLNSEGGVNYSGGAAGCNYSDATIEMVSAGVDVNAKGSTQTFIGGAVGVNIVGNSTIKNVWAYGNVDVKALGTGAAYVGGVVGYHQATEVINVYATGNITVERTGSSGSTYAGGVAGSVSSAVLRNAYATGNVEATGAGTRRAGGVAGNISGASATNISTLQNCVALNTTVSGASAAARVFNYSNSYYTGANNYAKTMTVNGSTVSSGTLTNGSGAPCDNIPPENWWKDETNWYSGIAWNFATIWAMGSDGYPKLQAAW